MPIGISDIPRPVLFGAALLALSSCAEGEGGDGLTAFRATTAAKPLRAAELAGGAVAVRGPSGYCIDAASLRKRGAAPFALLASCRVLTEGAAGIYVEPALMTVTVGAPGSATPPITTDDFAEALAEFAPTEQQTTDTLSIVRLSRGGDVAFDEAAPAHWRGAMRVGDRLVVLAVYGERGSPVTGRVGATLLIDLARATRAASAAAAPTTSAAPPAPTPAAQSTPAPTTAGFFRRLFN